MKNWTGIILFLTSLLLIACEANEIGTEIQPTEDKLSVKTDSFSVSAISELVSKRYSESDKLFLGKYDDPIYGSSKFDFLAEFTEIGKQEYVKTQKIININQISIIKGL